MDKPVRILNVTRVFKAAGIESFIMNMYRNIDRSKVQFDFFVMSNEDSCYDEEIQLLGGNKYTINVKANNTFIRIQKEAKALYEFLCEHEYKVIHIHYTTPLRAPYLLAAKKAGVPVRIYHSHSAEVSGKNRMKLFIYDYFRQKISMWGTDFFACSKAAATWMFTEKLIDSGNVKVIPNGIDCNRFRFRENVRDEVRKRLALEDSYVIIHTGRFLEQKNHKFIIEVFKELKKKETNAKLLLLGTGDLLEDIKLQVKSSGLEKDVVFLGVKTEVECYLCAADCYIMPSLYEGLPVAAVEAQCAGLPCVLSENITEEVVLRENVSFLSLDTPISEWRDEVIKYKNIPRKDGSCDVAASGYDVQNVANELQKLYLFGRKYK